MLKSTVKNDGRSIKVKKVSKRITRFEFILNGVPRRISFFFLGADFQSFEQGERLWVRMRRFVGVVTSVPSIG